MRLMRQFFSAVGWRRVRRRKPGWSRINGSALLRQRAVVSSRRGSGCGIASRCWCDVSRHLGGGGGL